MKGEVVRFREDFCRVIFEVFEWREHEIKRERARGGKREGGECNVCVREERDLFSDFVR